MYVKDGVYLNMCTSPTTELALNVATLQISAAQFWGGKKNKLGFSHIFLLTHNMLRSYCLALKREAFSAMCKA